MMTPSTHTKKILTQSRRLLGAWVVHKQARAAVLPSTARQAADATLTEMECYLLKLKSEGEASKITSRL